MRKKTTGMICTLALLGVVFLFAGPRAMAQQETILHAFNAPGDGSEPPAGVIMDRAGNLYGTTSIGPSNPDGMVYELSPVSGGWTEKILHSFNTGTSDGIVPAGALVMDSAGNLYGTTAAGGTRKLGVVFELSPQASGEWTEKIIHTFIGGSDGRSPLAGLIIDKNGNLYGTASQGGTGGKCGALGCGVVFELSKNANGAWAEKILYTFHGGTADGQNPEGRLTFDSAGNLYGTTTNGGAGGSINSGTAFKLSRKGSGGWTETILHSFMNNGTDGVVPYCRLALDSSGNLYGTTGAGGALGEGTVFELSPSGGSWTEVILHSFGGGNDGYFPQSSGLTFDRSGNLYGTTASGGAGAGGTVFKLTPTSGGGWTESTYFTFTFNASSGNSPTSGVIVDSSGDLFGTTQFGGTNSGGVAFEITP